MDDILVHGRTQVERLRQLLEKLQASGITLNKDKCQFSQTQIEFLGQVLSPSGVGSDPSKVEAIKMMKEPTNISEVRRFLGMANQLSKFAPNLADQTKPLRDLLSSKNQWIWGEPQRQAFSQVKHSLTTTPILALFDPNLMTTVSADASSFGLGAVLLQKQANGETRPVAYISRAMTPTEQRYAQIEKESLALTWASERFEDYLIGLHFTIETDHKPLVSLFGKKLLDELPLRVQRFCMRMMRFNFTIVHVPGKELSTADALSRAPVSGFTKTDETFDKEVNAYIQSAINNLPLTERKLDEIRSHQKSDRVCKEISTYLQRGWPNKTKVNKYVKPFYTIRDELSMYDGILIIPTNLQEGVLRQLHNSHQGINKTRGRAKESVWWPGLSTQIEEAVRKCPECIKHQVQKVEPLLSTPLPSLPWQRVATDLFEWKRSNYLVIIDFLSRWIEIARLERTSSECVINHIRSIFSRYGIPEILVSDNGPQYSSDLFKQFAKSYGFTHITSSPLYPQANGEAERAVKTVKNMLKKTTDPYLALLAYRSTPLSLGYTPSELMMCRKLRTDIPISREPPGP